MKDIETNGLLAGHYEIEGCIGTGGMGKVYRALQGKKKRPVAVKIIDLNKMSPEMRERFSREMDILMIDPPIPNVIHIEDYGEFEGHDFFVMTLLEGGTLKQRMELREKEGRALPSVTEVNVLVQKLCAALHTVHEYGIVHRDIKPANIMFDKGGNPYIIDFGIARDVNQTDGITLTGLGVGTLPYMSLDQRSGKEPSYAFDLYAMAVMMYQVLNGAFPYQSQGSQFSDQLARDIKTQAPLENWRSDLPIELRNVFEKAIWQESGNQYNNLLEFASDFQKAIQILDREDTGFLTFRVSPPPIDTHDLPSTLHTARKQSHSGEKTFIFVAHNILKRRVVWFIVPLFLALAIIATLTMSKTANTPTPLPSSSAPSHIVAIPSQEASSVSFISSATSAPTVLPVDNPIGPTATPVPPSSTPLPTLTQTPTACNVLLQTGLNNIEQWKASDCVQMQEDPQLGPMVLVPCLTSDADCKPLWVNQYEITRGQAGQDGDPTLPWANEVTGNRAANWCIGKGGGLLTADEWRRASGAAMGLIYPWGNKPRTDYPPPGSSYDPSSYRADVSWAGVVGMGGNVSEWVQDSRWMGSSFRSPDLFRIDGPGQRLSGSDPSVGFRCKRDWSPPTSS
jgi:serine/threonine-protein kinase